MRVKRPVSVIEKRILADGAVDTDRLIRDDALEANTRISVLRRNDLKGFVIALLLPIKGMTASRWFNFLKQAAVPYYSSTLKSYKTPRRHDRPETFAKHPQIL